MRSSHPGDAMITARRVRRSVLAVAVAAAAGFAVLHPGAVRALYEGVYPGDPAKREALDLCFMQDHKFDRLDSSERDDCYRRMLYPLGDVAAGAPATPPAANIVDLERAAGAGDMPRNDVRRQEATQGALHSPH